MSKTICSEGFAEDPIAPHSAHFPLGRVDGPVERSVPSAPGVRPWGLSGMRVARAQGDPVRAAFHFDHRTQTALDLAGRTLIAADPSADSDTDNDGDEGPSEDWTYDFCPDQPVQI